VARRHANPRRAHAYEHVLAFCERSPFQKQRSAGGIPFSPPHPAFSPIFAARRRRGEREKVKERESDRGREWIGGRDQRKKGVKKERK